MPKNLFFMSRTLSFVAQRKHKVGKMGVGKQQLFCSEQLHDLLTQLL